MVFERFVVTSRILFVNVAGKALWKLDITNIKKYNIIPKCSTKIVWKIDINNVEKYNIICKCSTETILKDRQQKYKKVQFTFVPCINFRIVTKQPIIYYCILYILYIIRLFVVTYRSKVNESIPFRNSIGHFIVSILVKLHKKTIREYVRVAFDQDCTDKYNKKRP